LDHEEKNRVSEYGGVWLRSLVEQSHSVLLLRCLVENYESREVPKREYSFQIQNQPLPKKSSNP
jgi:hypothetical protein